MLNRMHFRRSIKNPNFLYIIIYLLIFIIFKYYNNRKQQNWCNKLMRKLLLDDNLYCCVLQGRICVNLTNILLYVQCIR